jgi:hypothetical protein
VSSSVRDFTTLILSYWFVERVAEAGARDAELATFLKVGAARCLRPR